MDAAPDFDGGLDLPDTLLNIIRGIGVVSLNIGCGMSLVVGEWGFVCWPDSPVGLVVLIAFAHEDFG